ncbi:MAG: methyltransferase domain-containing protein [Ardenticatenaceae bacterium]|nr:methyltransferase domain-containing protein [Ardenticatenaceae bacterium]
MNHQDHVNLLRHGIPQPGGTWADLGAGHGAFTLALAELLGPTAVIHAIDKDQRALQQQTRLMSQQFPRTIVHYQTADFTIPLTLPPLDGIVAANTLHFVRHKNQTVQLWRSYLKTNGRLLIVEYNTDHGNHWVPHPFAYPTWQKLAAANGFTHTQLLATHPSRFLGEIYAAVSWHQA